MREAKFRGVYPYHSFYQDEEKWKYGYLTYDLQEEEYYIQVEGQTIGEGYWVVKDSIGQYTEIHDIKGKEIYTGDIVRYDPFHEAVGKVYYDEAETTYFVEPFNEEGYYEVLGLQSGVEVLGNEYENQKLLEVE